MQQLQLFTYAEKYPFRIIVIDGETWFIGKEVCDALGYVKAATAMGSHCKGVQKLYPLQTAGGMQETRIISEPDMLRLVINSTLPSAQRFESWVFEEVLPTIRKTGGYGVAVKPNSELLTDALKQRYVANLSKIPPWAFSALQMAETRFNWKLAQVGFQLPSGCYPDISIGQSFCKHMRERGYDTDSLHTYTHEWGNARRPVEAKLYPNEWLTEFQTWFDDQWIPKYLKSDSLRKHLAAPQLAHCSTLLIGRAA